MKKKIYRLTENDLTNIIKNIVREFCEIDDTKDQVMSSDWDLQDGGDLKYQQMSQDWDNFDKQNMYDKKFFDQLFDDNYSSDMNTNINDYHRQEYPF